MLKMLIALAALIASPAIAKSLDCPLRETAYSVDSPLMDIMLKPEAKAAVEHEMPGLFKRMPPIMASTTAPAFSAIMSVRALSHFSGDVKPELLVRVNKALAPIPVTETDKMARCVRYDDDVPGFTLATGHPRILLFEKMTGFRDGPSVEAAKKMVVDMAARNGWSLAVTDKGGAINAVTLKQFDAIIWNNVSGDVLTLTQRKALQSWIEKGGGFVAMHGSGGDPIYFWDWYVDTLIGARFTSHPMAPQFQDARINLEPSESGIGRGLGTGWMMKDEWYSFKTSARRGGAHVIATLDESSYSPIGMFKQDLRMGDHPIAWTRCVGNGRSFYSAIGHRPEGYTEPNHVKLFEQAVIWAAGNGQSACRDGKEVAVNKR
jgi:uncharacterized protein